MMLISLLSATTAKISEAKTRTCDDVLQMCDKALQDERGAGESLRKLNHNQQRLIEANVSLAETQRVKIDMLQRENSSVLKSPWLWFGVGLVTGVVVMKK